MSGCSRCIKYGPGIPLGLAVGLNASNHPEAESELERAGAHVVYLRRRTDGELCLAEACGFEGSRSYLGAGQAEILHVHNPFNYYIYGAVAARVAGATKIVNTTHLTAMFDHPSLGKRVGPNSGLPPC